MVDVDAGSYWWTQVGWLGLRDGSHVVPTTAFIRRTGWILIMALPWWQHHKLIPGITTKHQLHCKNTDTGLVYCTTAAVVSKAITYLSWRNSADCWWDGQWGTFRHTELKRRRPDSCYFTWTPFTHDPITLLHCFLFMQAHAYWILHAY